MTLLAALESRQGERTSIEYEFGESLATLALAGRVDVFIVSSEDGFSPLGRNLSFLSSDLDIPEIEIQRLANWNRFENPRITLVALRSRRIGSLLRGVVLAPSETSICYSPYSHSHKYPVPQLPNRSFYYNVAYEAIAFGSSNWGARRFSLSHLSGSGSFHEDIATCNAEALAHYCDAVPSAQVESFMFVGCCISPEHLTGIARLNAEAKTGIHHEISKEAVHCEGYVLVHLDWTRAQRFVQ
jgi:hypothetical protein